MMDPTIKYVVNSIARELSCGNCAPHPYVPEEVLRILGYGCRSAAVVDVRISKPVNPLSVESFVKALRIASRPFTRVGLEVVGILDPLWIPGILVDRLRLVVFRKCSSSNGVKGPRWALYRVDEGVYLQLLSSATASSIDELEGRSDRLRYWCSMLGLRLLDLEVAVRMSFERVPGLDALVTACIGSGCEAASLSDLILDMARRTMDRLGEEALTLVVGCPRGITAEGALMWVPAPSPPCIEALDAALSELGKTFSKCRALVEHVYADQSASSPYSSVFKQPILALLREVCKEVSVEIG